METQMYLSCLLYFFFYLLTRYVLQTKKNLPPSPGFSLPIIGHLYLFKKPLHKTLANLSKKYGPILFMQFGSRSVLLVSSPTLAEECFTKNDIIFANRPRLIAGKHLGYNYTTLVWASYGYHWRNLRRLASLEILSSHRLQILHHIRVGEVRSLVHKLYRASKVDNNFNIVDMKSIFFEFGLNVMMRTIAGKRYYGEKIKDLDEERMFKEIVTETFQLSGVTNIADFLPILKGIGRNGLERRMEKLQRKRDHFMQGLIAGHRRERRDSPEGERTKTMIEVLLALQESEPEYYTDEIIRGMMQVMLSAGTETSVATMEWALSLLLNNPDALSKAQTEIDLNLGQNKLIEESDLSKLPYLACIINETLRMYPVSPVLVPHESSEECMVGGYRIPRGTMLLVNLRVIQNDPNLWEDPTKFKPERFQGPEGARGGLVMFPFGTGRRGCPGEALARKLVGMAIGSLVQCFEWERIGEEMVDMSEGTGLTMPKAQPLLAKCRPRSTMVDLFSQF